MTSLSSLQVAIRADASSVIGTGHVFRCLALADELRRNGVQALFICRHAPGHMGDIIRGKGHGVQLIPDAADWQSDAKATKAALASFLEPVDWLIVDQYGLDARWEEAVRPMAKRLAAIDDLADRPHAVDLLIDSSHLPDEAGVYDPLLSPETRRAIGPDYVLLRREFFEQTPPERDHCAVRRILVTLGGNDPLNATGLALEALDDPSFANIQIDLTLGLANPRLEAMKVRASAMPNVTVHVQSSRMSELMAKADVCLGAGGTTSWERCYMGLPSLVLVLAENQRDFAAKLERMGCARNLGPADRIDVDQLRGALLAAISNAAWRRKTSQNGRELADGRGINRIVEHLQGGWPNMESPV
ncbi:UDP-2,4-diacetamido-2,4,6-trideoxy-beta-L-altropyranose hydrolase [Stappia sp. P2PMeth1]|uniref:UDP-2,4-diacetamido-2,4, 6-trideoxy-beta-L-altropyranose hydrolase n=1 Tax=Stappia sp. P2PMeth1 TaxID=2003586 RepID=UPI001647AB11|nr:UDP-2,4-diacetamido-2,4,6-trideoxy-beta-L-altropyranose hydrolase [Stappia sp. P2PMeth1]